MCLFFIINKKHSELQTFPTWFLVLNVRLCFLSRKRPTAEICLSHSWLQQWDFGNLFHPEETSSSSQSQDHTVRSSEDKTSKSSCNGTCSDREDKENIPEDSSMVSKRFRFDDSLPNPHELVSDLLC